MAKLKNLKLPLNLTADERLSAKVRLKTLLLRGLD